jgi:hypothetical protein
LGSVVEVLLLVLAAVCWVGRSFAAGFLGLLADVFIVC